MRVGIIVIGLCLGWSVLGQSAHAGVAITSTNRTWETATNIGQVTEPVQLFGALGSAGDARYYRMTVKEPGTMSASIHVPLWAVAKFRPQLVLYQPDAATVGPVLPVIQPPDTIALVYPINQSVRAFEPWTQISAVRRLAVTLDLPVAGTYYLAVYNADSTGGRFRLTLSPTADDMIPTGLFGWPKSWWISHLWAVPTILTLFAPFAAFGVIMVIVWTGMHWKAPKTKKQITTRKKVQ